MAQVKDILKMFLLTKLVLLQISTVFAEETRIVGGTTTTIKNLPYMVQLLDKGDFFCGGTLVSSRFVVTAAHCVKGMKPRQLTIVAGASKLSETGVRSKVSKITLPKGYKPSTMHMDVAVLKLSNSVTGKNIRPVALCTQSWAPGAPIQVSGWGIKRENGKISNQVRSVKLNVVSNPKCNARYQNQISESMFCAYAPGLKDSCSGDSGGPAIYNGQLCGIVSWGNGCARNGIPGVYTDVKAARTFILKAMKT